MEHKLYFKCIRCGNMSLADLCNMAVPSICTYGTYAVAGMWEYSKSCDGELDLVLVTCDEAG